MTWALLGLIVLALLFRLLVWASTRAALTRVSSAWVIEKRYWRGGDDL